MPCICFKAGGDTETLEPSGECDVIVAGDGLSGAAASLAAARAGKRVLLIEKQCSLGGLATTGLVNFWLPLCNGRGKWIIRGMAEEFLQPSIQHGFDTLPPEWKHGEPAQPTMERCVTWFSSGLFSLALLRLLRQSGVTILYDALISQPVMEGMHCAGLVVDGKSGRKFYQARMVIEGIFLEGCKRAIEKHNLFYVYTRSFGRTADLHGHQQPESKMPYRGVSMEMFNQ